MVRIDKFIWAVRLFKTRSLAASACKEGKIRVNDLVVKSSKLVGLGDVISIRKQGSVFSYKVIDVLDKRVGAKLVDSYMENITPLEELEKFKLHQLAQKEYRKKGEGRPTKKDRRFLDDWNEKKFE